MDEANGKVDLLVKNILSEQLGIDIEDIQEGDSLTIDLHMTPSDLIDLFERLKELGYNLTDVDLTEVETVDELIERIAARQLLD